MLFNAALFTSLILAPEAVAFPSGLAARLARRREGRRSQPSEHLASDTSAGFNEIFDPRWAGAALENGNGTFIGTTVVGTFTVPTASGSSGDSASVWVGIDGSTCKTAILQTGISFTVTDDGSTGYGAWYEWYPDAAYNFTEISFSAGDQVRLTVVSDSTTSGTARIENLTNGQAVWQSLSNATPLCGQDAEWIIEDYPIDANGDPVPFANFGSVVFTDASAEPYRSLEDATIYDIQQNGEVLTSTSTSGSSVTIQYTGEN